MRTLNILLYIYKLEFLTNEFIVVKAFLTRSSRIPRSDFIALGRTCPVRCSLFASHILQVVGILADWKFSGHFRRNVHCAAFPNRTWIPCSRNSPK